MAAVVSDTMRGLLRDQVKNHGLVLWFDPAGHYRTLAGTLGDSLDGTPILRLGISLLELRRRAEPFIHPLREDGSIRDRPSEAILYLPIERDRPDNALCDLIACGTVLAPRALGNANTALEVIARKALVGRVGAAALESFVAGAKTGKYTLSDLDQIADRGANAGLISIIFGTDEPARVALRFVTETSLDQEIVQRQLFGDLGALLNTAVGLPIEEDTTVEALRQRLVRYLLLTEFVNGLGPTVPKQLTGLAVATKETGRRAAAQLVGLWRNSRDLAESYRSASEQIAEELGHDTLAALPTAALRRTTTFLLAESALLKAIVTSLAAGNADDDLVEATRRLDGFWAVLDPSLRVRWRLVVDAGEALRLAREIARQLKRSRAFNSDELVRLYTDNANGREPWSALDTHHRRLLASFHSHGWTDNVEPDCKDEIDRLVATVRKRHGEITNDLAEAFSSALERARFSVPGVAAQADLFAQRIGRGSGERLAYVLVDALRFEMARDLVEPAIPDWTATLEPALATFPSITPVGMSALMPGAERGITLAATGKAKKLAVEVGSVDLSERSRRIETLKVALPGLMEIKLGDLTALSPPRRKQLEAAPVVILTSQEIDELAEQMDSSIARRVMNDILTDLRAAFRILGGAGITKIVVVADHGYLFGDDVSKGETIDAPGGETIEIKRRVWIGRGGASEAGYLRLSAADVGLGGDLEFATPRSAAVFAAPGGSTDYFHGGLSLQELVIPVLELTRKGPVVVTSTASKLAWELTPGSKAITTAFFSITIQATSAEAQLGLLPQSLPRIRVELRRDSNRIGSPISASYGFDQSGGEIALQKNTATGQGAEQVTVTFQIAEGITDGTAIAVVTDALSGREIARSVEIPISISF